MTYSHEVEHMCVVKKGQSMIILFQNKWKVIKEIKDISRLTHGGWLASHRVLVTNPTCKEGINQILRNHTVAHRYDSASLPARRNPSARLY